MDETDQVTTLKGLIEELEQRAQEKEQSGEKETARRLRRIADQARSELAWWEGK